MYMYLQFWSSGLRQPSSVHKAHLLIKHIQNAEGKKKNLWKFICNASLRQSCFMLKRPYFSLSTTLLSCFLAKEHCLKLARIYMRSKIRRAETNKKMSERGSSWQTIWLSYIKWRPQKLIFAGERSRKLPQAFKEEDWNSDWMKLIEGEREADLSNEDL